MINLTAITADLISSRLDGHNKVSSVQTTCLNWTALSCFLSWNWMWFWNEGRLKYQKWHVWILQVWFWWGYGAPYTQRGDDAHRTTWQVMSSVTYSFISLTTVNMQSLWKELCKIFFSFFFFIALKINNWRLIHRWPVCYCIYCCNYQSLLWNSFHLELEELIR